MTYSTEWNENSMLEIVLLKDDNFLKVKETLTRIGVPSKQGNKLFQSCHILHKRGKFYIVHFKEMFALDNKLHSLSETDFMRRNAIAYLLQEWNLIRVLDEDVLDHRAQISEIKIIPYKDKDKWELIAKYTIGKKS